MTSNRSGPVFAQSHAGGLFFFFVPSLSEIHRPSIVRFTRKINKNTLPVALSVFADILFLIRC